MRDVLTFYYCDTFVLEEKILTREMIEGNEVGGHLERQGRHLGVLHFDSIYIGEVLQALEAVTGAPFHYLMGQGERRIGPPGPVSFCSRHDPKEFNELLQAMGRVMRRIGKSNLSGNEKEKQDQWVDLAEKINLAKEPKALSRLRRFLEGYLKAKPELVSVYERW